MISFPELPEIIWPLRERGSSLASLRNSPTSSALVGILARRVGFQVLETIAYSGFDLFVCDDSLTARLPLRSPFGVVCLATDSSCDVAKTHGRLLDALEEKRMQGKPVLLFHPDGLQDWAKLLDLVPKRFVTFSSTQIVDVLLARPPRTALMDRVVAETPLRDLNPYTYRGPIGGSLFFGRTRELESVTKLEHSFTVVGPRTIGKTSLIYRAYQTLRARSELAIRTEFSPALTEDDLHDQIVNSLINDYGVDQKFQTRTSIPKTQRFLARFATQFPSKRALIFVDEADEVVRLCPELSAELRALHNIGAARLVFVGFKKLRKAANDATNSPLMNVFEDLPLTGLALQDCGGLVLIPMTAMGIAVEQPEKVVETIFRETGGAPSRIQLVCSALVEDLDRRGTRTLTLRDVEASVRLPRVQGIVRTWFRESTTPLERQLARLVSVSVPCAEHELVRRIKTLIPEWPEHEIKAELDDLETADVLTPYTDGKLCFSFPSLRDVVGPPPNTRTAFTETVHELRKLVRQDTLSVHE